MITSVTHKPHTYMPAWSPIVWTALSDKAGKPDMKYVFDIYKADAITTWTFVARVKQRPNPTGACSIDISTLAQLQLFPSKDSLETKRIGQYYPTNWMFDLSPNRMLGFKVLAGEDVNGIIYNGTTDGKAEPAYALLSEEGLAVRCYPGAESIYDSKLNDSSADDKWGIYSGYNMDGDGQFLTTLNENWVRPDDRHTLSFFNRVWGVDWDLSSPWAMRIDYWPVGGLTASTSYITNTVYGSGGSTKGGGPRSYSLAGLTSTDWNHYSYEFETVACGPLDLEAFIGTDISKYEISLVGVTGGESRTAGDKVSETITFNVDYSCENFAPVRFSWLNKLGGRDYFNFDMYKEESFDIAPKTFFKDPNSWEASTWSLQPMNAGLTVYDKPIKKKVKATSDWLTFEEINYLKGLFTSPDVLVWLDGGNQDPQTCAIVDTSYTVREIKLEKMYNLTFTFEVSWTDKTQTT